MDTFRQCRTCGRIYWQGSHQARLSATVEAIRTRLDQSLLAQ
ncbi:Mut7-C RNAse domain-containing protein [Nocardia vinacea]